MSDNRRMNTAPTIWIQHRDRADFAAEATPAPHWLQQARALGRWHSPAHHWSTPLEVALWSLAAEPVQDGLFPWAEWSAQQAGHDGGHWAEWHLCHWHVSNGQVTLLRPQWPTPDALDRLWRELSDFVASDGLTLVRDGAERAWVRGEMLAQLPTAHVDKVMGRPVAAFLPESRAWRRLQNELQMWFYSHPVLQGMATPINSVWLCGTGRLTPTLAQVLARLQWADAAATPPTGTQVLIAGDEDAQFWQVGSASAWQRLWRRWRPVTWEGPGA